MRKNSLPTADRGTSLQTNAAVLDRHFPARNKAPQERRILPVSKEASRTSASDRLPDLLLTSPAASPAEAPRKETEKPGTSISESKTPEPVDSLCMDRSPETERAPQKPVSSETSSGLLTCPSPRNDESMLLQQSIPMSHCEQRQAKSYHKCANCSLAKGRQFKGVGLPPLENSPAHLQHARLLGLFGPDGEWLRR